MKKDNFKKMKSDIENDTISILLEVVDDILIGFDKVERHTTEKAEQIVYSYSHLNFCEITIQKDCLKIFIYSNSINDICDFKKLSIDSVYDNRREIKVNDIDLSYLKLILKKSYLKLKKEF